MNDPRSRERRRCDTVLRTGRPSIASLLASSVLMLLGTGAAIQPELVVTTVHLSDNGDDDGWADTAESVAMTVVLRNLSDSELSDVRLRLTSQDPEVGCLTRSLVVVGNVAAGATVLAPEAFEWIVAPSAERASLTDELSAEFAIHVDAAEFTQPLPPQRITVDLDLDATGGAQPTVWHESFESGFGSFTTMHVDEDLNPPDSDLGNREAGVINADGARCQYSDPEWSGSAAYGHSGGEHCFPNPNNISDLFFFAVATDRAFSGTQSMRYNRFLSPGLGYSTPTNQIDAVATGDPINLGYARVCSVSRTTSCEAETDCPAGETCGYAAPTLTLKHQISHLDHRTISNMQAERSLGRSIVAVQLTDQDAAPVGHWVKVYPYVNVYDSMANSNFFACTFDPPDDGNTESDFFDPTDPIRSHGPSSTCAPEFNFAHQGDTDAPFDPSETGDAYGPGLEGSFGMGTWVEPAFDLSRYRGRRLRVRFLSTDRKTGGGQVWEDAFHWNPEPGDDGWFIDDVTVTDALVIPATASVDASVHEGLAQCGDFFCGQAGGVEPVVDVTPAGATAGETIEIDASSSTVDVCLDGTLEYRFWIDADGNGAYDAGHDPLLRDWSYRTEVTDVLWGTTRYAVQVRCESDPACGVVETLRVEIDCPGPGDGVAGHETPFLHDAPPERRPVLLDGILIPGGKRARLIWTTEATVDVVRGDLSTLRGAGMFGAGEACAVDNQTDGTVFIDPTAVLADGDALFWLLRSAESCDDPGAGGSYGQVGETVDRDAISVCPD